MGRIAYKRNINFSCLREHVAFYLWPNEVQRVTSTLNSPPTAYTHTRASAHSLSPPIFAQLASPLDVITLVDLLLWILCAIAPCPIPPPLMHQVNGFSSRRKCLLGKSNNHNITVQFHAQCENEFVIRQNQYGECGRREARKPETIRWSSFAGIPIANFAFNRIN